MHWFALVMLFFYLLWEKRRLNKKIKEAAIRLEQVEELLLEVCGILDPVEEDATPASKEKGKTSDSVIDGKEDVQQPTTAEGGKDQQEPLPKTKTQGVGGGSFLFEEQKEATPQPGENSHPKIGSEAKQTTDGDGKFMQQAMVTSASTDRKVVSKGTGETTAASGRKKSSKASTGSRSSRQKAAEREHLRTVKKAKTSNQKREGDLTQKRNKTGSKEESPKELRPDEGGQSVSGRKTSGNPLSDLEFDGLSTNRRQTIIELSKGGTPTKEIARQVGMGQGEVQLIIDLYSKK
jgi:hypothetical protein